MSRIKCSPHVADSGLVADVELELVWEPGLGKPETSPA